MRRRSSAAAAVLELFRVWHVLEIEIVAYGCPRIGIVHPWRIVARIKLLDSIHVVRAQYIYIFYCNLLHF